MFNVNIDKASPVFRLSHLCMEFGVNLHKEVYMVSLEDAQLKDGDETFT